MAEDLKILVEQDGTIKLLDRRLQRWLSQRSGLWRLVPTAENLLVFNRLGKKGSKPVKGSGRTGNLQLTGSISEMGGLTDIITFLNNSKRTGALVVLSDNVKKTLFFSDGDVRMATSNVAEDRLGSLMYRFGLVTREQLDEALARQSGSRRLGRVLIDMGVITAHDLYTVIQRQVKEIFYSILLLRNGVVYFYNLEGDNQVSSQINLSTRNLLLEGVRRIDEMSYFRQRIPSKHSIIERRPETTPQDLDEKETLVYDLIDGMSSVDEIARESQLGEFETTKVLFRLIQQSLAQRRRDTDITRIPIAPKGDEKSDGYDKLVDVFNIVFRKIYSAVQAKGKEPALREGLDSFFEGATGFVDLYQGVEILADGALPPGAILDNLGKIETESKIDFLYHALNELLFFEMFTAGEALPRDDEEELQRQLNKIFRNASKATPQR